MMTDQQIIEAVADASRILLLCARRLEPEVYGSVLNSVMANAVGNLTDEYWQEFNIIRTCGELGCDCHILKEKTVEFLNILRKDFQDHVESTDLPTKPKMIDIKDT